MYYGTQGYSSNSNFSSLCSNDMQFGVFNADTAAIVDIRLMLQRHYNVATSCPDNMCCHLRAAD